LKIYIAGKISGDANYYQKFKAEEEYLKSCGHIVLNPAELPPGMSAADYMRICFSMIDSADAVYFLSDFRDSPGAKLELVYCRYIKKQVIFADKS